MLPMFDVRGEISGPCMALTYLAALVAFAVSLSILMADALLLQRRTGKSGWVDTIWTFAPGLAGATAAPWPIAGAAPNARRSRGDRDRAYRLHTGHLFPLPPRHKGVAT